MRFAINGGRGGFLVQIFMKSTRFERMDLGSPNVTGHVVPQTMANELII